MDPTLVNGLLGIAGTLATGGLGLATLLVKKHMATLDIMAKSVQELVVETKANNTLTRDLATRVTSLETAIDDNRSTAILDQSKEATILLRASLATVTGQQAAVSADRLPIIPDLEVPRAPPRAVPK